MSKRYETEYFDKLRMKFTNVMVKLYFNCKNKFPFDNDLIEKSKEEVIGWSKFEWGKDCYATFYDDRIEFETLDGKIEVIKA